MSEAHSIDSLSDEAFGWYLTGLVDGEGCFMLADGAIKNISARRREAIFTIILRADDGNNLKAIARRVGCGKVYWYKHTGKVGNGKPVNVWRTNRLDELFQVIIPHFDRFPLQCKKRRDFAIWKEGVKLLHAISKRKKRTSGKRGGFLPVITKAEQAFFAELKAKLKDVRRYTSPGLEISALPPLPVEDCPLFHPPE